MAELKTQLTGKSVEDFLATISDPQKRADSQVIFQLFQKLTGEQPAMWGSSIVGFGKRHLKYASGRELDWMLIAFSPRKQALVLYIMDSFTDYKELLERLGKHSVGRGCLYIKKLTDIDMNVLQEITKTSIQAIRSQSES